ncbi:unnamed protein product [Phyllotreta striolata]|uniref:C2H2-type domain-containing protein n=1 Tax=Phyllotreta striolata TaxID=444603 RepID=A0A9N9XWD0_PHYSR|nr:unnamed protein product [Phyllotreta striolata]
MNKLVVFLNLGSILIFIWVKGFDAVHPCPHCEKSFKVASSLRRHVRYFCGKKPPPLTGYRKLADDDFVCSKCDKHYKLYCTLKRHIIHECDKPKKIRCPVAGCRYMAKMNDRMLNHCRMVHKIDI